MANSTAELGAQNVPIIDLGSVFVLFRYRVSVLVETVTIGAGGRQNFGTLFNQPQLTGGQRKSHEQKQQHGDLWEQVEWCEQKNVWQFLFSSFFSFDVGTMEAGDELSAGETRTYCRNAWLERRSNLGTFTAQYEKFEGKLTDHCFSAFSKPMMFHGKEYEMAYFLEF